MEETAEMKVLIVDDDPGTRELLSEVAQKFGVTQVDTAENGVVALALATKSVYDLVTLDIRMPIVTGLDILSVIHALCPHAVIAMMSGYLADAAGSRNVELYADVCLAKPVDCEEFERLLELTRRLVVLMKKIRGLSTDPNH